MSSRLLLRTWIFIDGGMKHSNWHWHPNSAFIEGKSRISLENIKVLSIIDSFSESNISDILFPIIIVIKRER